MKALKKVMAIVTAGAVVASVGALVACGTTPEKEPQKDTTPQIAYQFTGEFTNDTLRGFGFDYYVMLNLYDNNKVAGSGYNCLSLDTRTASENTGFSEKWFRGTWEVTKDEEDQDCIKLTAIYDADAKNGMTGGALTNTSTYYLYKKSGSQDLSNFKLQSPIFSGTTEYMTEMSQNKTPYKTADDFIKASAFKQSLPTEYQAVFETTAQSDVVGKIYIMSDGKAEVYSGKKGPGSNEYMYIKGETWEWSYSAGKLVVTSTSNNTKTPYEATVTGTTATLDFSVNLMGNVMNYKYACADISKLSETGGETPAEPTVLATFNGTNGATLTVYENNTAKASFFGGQMNINFTWALSDGVLTLTDAVTTTKVYTSVTAGGSTTVAIKDGYADDTFTLDLSKLTPAAPTVVATLSADDGKTVKFYNDGTAKVDTGIPQLSPTWRWTKSGNTVTFKNADNDEAPSGLTFTVEGNNATLIYAPAFLQGQSFTYTGDVSALLA